MSFKWKVVRPFVAASGNVAVTTAGLNLEFETGSIEEALGFFADKGTALAQIFGASIVEQFAAAAAAGTSLTTGTVDTGEATGETKPETAAQKKVREKREAKEKSDAARVNVDPPNAPPPVPVGGATAPDTTPGTNGIPAFLDRTKETAAAAPPAPPVAPPPPTPPVPPAGVLAAKIIPHMEGVAAQQNDGGKAWVDWLASSGIVVAGATFDEAMKVIRMQSDEKLAPIASALGIAA
jgi:hypothetical protein